MNAKKLFVILLILQIGGLAAWYLLIYQPQQNQIQGLDLQLRQTFEKLKSANRAQIDLKNIENRLESEKKELEALKLRFVNKNELSKVTVAMQEMASKYQLALTDFAPVMDNYFTDTTYTRIKTIPLAITVEGNYINIGRYLEKWEDFPFYIVPEEIFVEKINDKSNELQAVVTGKLYCWSN